MFFRIVYHETLSIQAGTFCGAKADGTDSLKVEVLDVSGTIHDPEQRCIFSGLGHDEIMAVLFRKFDENIGL